MLVVVAVIKAKVGMEQEVEKAIKEMVPKVEAEKDTLSYTLHRAKKEPGKFLIYEKYTSKEALTQHSSTPYFIELFRKIGPMLDGAPIIDIYEDLVGIREKK